MFLLVFGACPRVLTGSLCPFFGHLFSPCSVWSMVFVCFRVCFALLLPPFLQSFSFLIRFWNVFFGGSLRLAWALPSRCLSTIFIGFSVFRACYFAFSPFLQISLLQNVSFFGAVFTTYRHVVFGACPVSMVGFLCPFAGIYSHSLPLIVDASHRFSVFRRIFRFASFFFRSPYI